MSDQPENQNLSAPPALPPRRASGYATLALVLAFVAVLISGWQWFESKRSLALLELDAARRIAELDATNRENRALATQSRDTMSDATARLGQLEARLFETQNQRMALEALYRDLSRGRDEWTLAEVEQVLLIASQQLQLAGNVKAALIALETADTRLARMDRPQLTALRRVINQDMERLKAVPAVDVIGLALKLDAIIGQVEGLPLAMEQRPSRNAAADDPPPGFWSRAWREFKQDMHDLIRIQNVEKPEFPLLSPDQAFFLRENLKIRLLGARLSLLAHDESSFKSDIKSASDWLTRYYDGGNKTVAGSQATLKQLQQTEFGGRIPDISASLEAVRGFKLVRERPLR